MHRWAHIQAVVPRDGRNLRTPGGGATAQREELIVLNRFALKVTDTETIEIEQYPFGYHGDDGPPRDAVLVLGVNGDDGVPEYEYVIRVLSPIPLTELFPGS
jgi:hypothetical protein